MDLNLTESEPPTTEDAVAAAQKALALTFPAAYRAFLLTWNGGRPNLPIFPISGMPLNPKGNVNFFFGVDAAVKGYDLIRINRFYSIPRDVLLIAENGMGDYIGLDLRDGGERVAFWDHRHFWGTGEWREGDLYSIATSFADFLANLGPWDN